MSWDKKAYDREYQRKRANIVYEDFRKRRLLVFNLFNNKCFVCGKNAIKGFHLHHKEYHEIESDYPRSSKSMVHRLKRLAEAEKHPERFALLCPRHHMAVELLKSLSCNDFEKLIELVKLSTPTMRKQETQVEKY